MTPDNLYARRSMKEWAVRGGLAIVATTLGCVSIGATLASVIQSSDPFQAHFLAPWDGRITAQVAEEELRANPASNPQSPAGQLARMALIQDATAVSAATTLGLQKQLRGDFSGARSVLAYSQQLSRRDLRAQLWAIEDAISRDDLPGALHHYDTALRFSDQASELLFPILASAVADPSVRSAAVKNLSSRPPWSPLFLEYIADRGPDPRAAGLLLKDLAQAGHPVSGLTRALLTQKLKSLGFIEDAWSLYASFRPGVRPTLSRDPAFAADLENPTIFDWQSVATEGRVAAITHGKVDMTAPPGIGGSLIQQLQKLPAGGYRLTGHSISIKQPEASLPYWVLTCGDGRELGRVAMPNSSVNAGTFVGTFNVPVNCSFQLLALIAPPSDVVSGFSGQLDRVQLEPNN